MGITSHCCGPSLARVARNGKMNGYTASARAFCRVEPLVTARRTTCTSGRVCMASAQSKGAGEGSIANRVTAGLTVAAAGWASLLLAPGAAHAEALPALEQYVALLRGIEELGPAGIGAFAVLVTAGEMIPLFPTQPLAIGAGVLFPLPVAIPVVLLANLCAATGAFFISRGPGKEFAKRVIRMETHGEEDKEEGGGLMGAVESSVKGSGPVAQGLGVMLLRFSPVTPYSASNYILGLTPIPFVPYIAGTALGMLPWAVTLTSLGRASRSLLEGSDPALAMEELGNNLSAVTSKAAEFSGVALGVAVGALVLSRVLASGSKGDASQPQGPDAGVASVDGEGVLEKAVERTDTERMRV